MILINRGQNHKKNGGFHLHYNSKNFTLRFIHSDRMEVAGYRRNKSEHRHSIYHIIVFQRGTGTILLDNKSISVSPGISIFISPGQLHSLGILESENLSYGEVTFEFIDDENNQLSLDFSSLLSKISGINIKVPALVTNSDLNAFEKIDPFLQEISDLRSYQGKDPFFHISTTSVLLKLLTTLAGLFSDLNRSEKMVSPIKKIHSYIEKNYQQPLTLENLAQIGSLNQKYLSRRFKEFYGQTPIYFRDSLRIDSACELLRGSHYMVGEIAEKCGFTDVYYFSKIFKKKIGMSPMVFRNQSLGH